MHENFKIWPYARKKKKYVLFFNFLGFVWKKKFISPYNKTTQISLKGVCQTLLNQNNLLQKHGKQTES